MLYTLVKVTIKNNVAFCDKQLVLYRGDKNVEIQFEIVERTFLQYKIEEVNIIKRAEATKGQLIIVKPEGTIEASEISEVKNGRIAFTIPRGMINEAAEVGKYTFQIRLFNEELTSQATLPPCIDGLIIAEPIITDF